MIKELHIAAQYLAAAGISFIKKREDDSHTNLGWSKDRLELSTWPLSEKGDLLSLSLKTFSLVWSKGEVRTEFPLNGKSHLEVMTWIKSQAKSNIGMIYIYHLHYELPYPFPSDDFVHSLTSPSNLGKVSNLFDISQSSFIAVLNQQELSSEIRVWPHHFDLGAYAVISETLSLGFGLAIPDSGINDFYYYISGYKGHDSLETKNFEKLENGEWQTEEWKAGTLRASNVNIEKAIGFLNNAIATFRKHYN